MDRLTLTLPDGQTLRMCLACGVGEHEKCANDPAVCNGCAVCRSTLRTWAEALRAQGYIDVSRDDDIELWEEVVLRVLGIVSQTTGSGS